MTAPVVPAITFVPARLAARLCYDVIPKSEWTLLC